MHIRSASSDLDALVALENRCFEGDRINRVSSVTKCCTRPMPLFVAEQNDED